MSSNESDVKKFCGNYDNENPLEQSSDGNKMLVKFDSDKLFRYKGFHCRFRAIQSNGISVINSFVDETEGKFIKLTCYSPISTFKCNCFVNMYTIFYCQSIAFTSMTATFLSLYITVRERGVQKQVIMSRMRLSMLHFKEEGDYGVDLVVQQMKWTHLSPSITLPHPIG